MSLRTLMFGILSEWRKLLTLLSVTALFSMMLPLTVPLIERAIIKSLEQSTTSLPWWVWAAIVFLFPWRSLRLLNEALRWTLHIRYMVGAMTGLRDGLLKQVFLAAGRSRVSAGDAVNRIRYDVRVIVRFVSSCLRVVLRSLTILIALIILLRINARVTLVVFFPMCAIFLVVQAMSPYIMRTYRATRDAAGEVAGFVGDLFSAIQAVQIAGAESAFLSRLRVVNQKRKKTAIRNTLIVNLLNSALAGVHQLAVAITIFLSIGELRSGAMTFGDFLVFVGYFHWISSFSADFGQILIMRKQARVSWERLRELVNDERVDILPSWIDLDGALPAVGGFSEVDGERLQCLEVRSLQSHYAGSQHGIKGLNLRIPQGSFNVICGRMGAGKTTALKAVIGLAELQAGEILWNGRVVVEPARFFRPRRCSYAAQTPTLVSASLQDNILLGRSQSGHRLESVIRSAGLQPDLRNLEKGLDTLVGPRGTKLSGGQLQRVAAARMMATESQLWVFDDISSAIDGETQRRLWECLSAAGRTCLLTSNKRGALKRADQIVVLKNGRVEAIGKWQDLMASCSEFSKIWEGQSIGKAP